VHHRPRAFRRGIGVAIALGLAGLSWVEPVSATQASTTDARELARALADQGADAYAERDYHRAQVLFARAYDLVRAPTIALFEARTLMQLGRWLEARAAYQRAAEAKLEPDAPQPFRDAASTARTELATLTPRLPRVRVRVDADTAAEPGFEVWLDGRRLGKHELESSIAVDPGAHRVEVRGDEVARAPIEFQLAAGEAKVVAIDGLLRAERDPKRTWAFVGLGVGAAGLITGVTAGVISLNARDDAKRLCDGNTCPTSGPGRDALDRFRTYRTISTVGYVLGAIGGGAGVTLLVLSDDESKRELELSAGLDRIRLEGRW
jgi:hypothetical protein